MSYEQRYSDGRLYIDEESFPVEECTFGMETIHSRQLPEFTFTCDVDLKLVVPDPLCDIDFCYTTHKRRLFVDVPIQNRVHIGGTRVVTDEGVSEVTCEVSFQGGDWTLEVGKFSWKEWWRALWARLTSGSLGLRVERFVARG